jgi:uroporphyrinogen-III synthase
MKAIVTRPRDDAAPLMHALAERGIDALLAPMLTIRPAPQAARHLAERLTGAQAVLFTSANGVRAFAAASPRRELPVLAVGDASAAAARIAGFRSVASADGDIEDLAALVAAHLSPQAGALVHAAGTTVAGDLAGKLTALGFTVHRATLYEAVPAEALDPETAAAMRRGETAAALFFSPRTAATFVRLAAAAGVGDACRPMVAVALSPAVAAALAALSWQAVRVAARPVQADLLAALDVFLAEGAAQPGFRGA